jgi:GNAT superfamily N-acetyltransferase
VAGIELIRDENDDALARGLRVVATAFPERAITTADLRGYVDAFPHIHLLAVAGGEDAGRGLVVIEPLFRPTNGAHSEVTVAPARRREGIGTALFAAMVAWAKEQGLAELRSIIKEGDDESLAWARRRGFEEFARELRLELDLRTFDPPPVDPPAGIEIVTWAERPDAARGLYEVYMEAAPDIPGSDDDAYEPFEDWLAHDMGGPGDRPEATFVAFAGDEVVGYSKFSLTDAQPTVAFHDLTGVKRAWRGRGIAAALKRTQMAWAKEHGYERLSTNNEERNEPIRRLNERYGYRPVPGRIFVRGPLA